MKTYAGYAYREVDVDVHKGELVAVRGRNGSGKTALLLTLAGRMKQTEGTLNVGEFELPRQRSKAERHVGLGLFSGLNDLQAVSYTHLDVYKRQLWDRTWSSFPKTM